MQINSESSVPNILLLPDGNRRWAQNNSVSFEDAYQIGAHRIVAISQRLSELGADQLWLGLARPFNFQRTDREIRAVLDACLLIRQMGREGGRPFNITINSDVEMPGDYLSRFQEQADDSQPNGFTAHLLIGWSALTDIAHYEPPEDNDYSTKSVRKRLLESSAVKEPIDFLIRSGVGGQGGRISEMIPPHSLGAELYFTPTLFPDFEVKHLDAALEDYYQREHRDCLSLQTPQS